MRTEVVLGPEDGLPQVSAVRCDFLILMFKHRLTQFVAPLAAGRIEELNRALQHALELPT